jgi:hypothetical protein
MADANVVIIHLPKTVNATADFHVQIGGGGCCDGDWRMNYFTFLSLLVSSTTPNLFLRTLTFLTSPTFTISTISDVSND